MEIGENGEKSAEKSVIHSIASVPTFRSENESLDGAGGYEYKKKSRRVSFAASSQFLEPINPFDVLGKAEKKIKSLLLLLMIDFEQGKIKIVQHLSVSHGLLFFSSHHKFQRAFKFVQSFMRQTSHSADCINYRASGSHQLRVSCGDDQNRSAQPAT